ncbi:MAG TPA: radical SAM protein [Bryobacteraceae bacterium]|nr:radical SAM protein [Bryobacteraceae bacterium]
MGDKPHQKFANLELVLRTIGQASGERAEIDAQGFFEGKPLLLWLETTARCNLRCAKCGHSFDPPGTPRILPRNLPDAVVDEADAYFAAAVKVRVSGYGEMFLYSRLRSLVERLKRHECWVEGTTNGVVIDRSEVDWLVDLGWDQLVFSIDGAEPDTMQRLRGADLQKIWDILEYIKRRKQESNTTKPQVVVGFVAQSDNLHELPALVRKLADLNVCFLAVNTLHHQKYAPGSDDPYGKLCHDYSLARLDRRRVEALIAEGRTLAEQANIGYGVYIDLDRVYREADQDAADELVSIFSRVEEAPRPQESLKPFYCVYPWTSLFVTARGSTTVCCSMRGDIGTVSGSGDLDRVWNGETLRAIRRSIARGEVHANCAYCVSRNRHLSSFVDLDEAKDALAAWKAAPAPDQPAAAIPAGAVFGYLDTRELQGRSGSHLRIAGWAASRRLGAPVREVKLSLNGRDLNTIRQFYERPDVAAYFGRENLRHSGWQVFVNLPPLRPGLYPLEVEVTDIEGASGKLDVLFVRVTE